MDAISGAVQGAAIATATYHARLFAIKSRKLIAMDQCTAQLHANVHIFVQSSAQEKFLFRNVDTNGL